MWLCLLLLTNIMFHEVKTACTDNTIHLAVGLSVCTLEHAAPFAEGINSTLPIAAVVIVATSGTIEHTRFIHISRRVYGEEPGR